MGFEALISPERLQALMLIMARVSALMMSAPFLGATNIPKTARIGLALLLSIILLPVVHVEAAARPLGALDLILGMGHEIIIGLLIGFSTQLLMAGIVLSGQLNGVQMGFAIANLIDPSNMGQISIIAILKSMLALLVFVSLNVHHLLIRAVHASFETLPPMGYGLSNHILLDLVHLGGDVFATGLKLAAPVYAVILFTQVSLGIVARTVPSMGVLFNIGFSITIILGLMTLGLAFPFYSTSLQQLFGGLETVFARWFGM